MKAISIALSLLAVFLLSGGGLVAVNACGSSQQLSVAIAGGVVNAGSQTYYIQQSGQAISANLAGYNINPSRPIQFNYMLIASVQGQSASGLAMFELKASLTNGGSISVTGVAGIVAEVPAICFPSLNASGVCASTDTSTIPAYFVSGQGATLVIASTTNGHTHVQTVKVPMLFESAYLNPFGGPIVLGSGDNFATFLVITTYSKATIGWSGVVTAGQISGTYGNTQISGALSQVTSQQENLVTGTTVDTGTMTFSNMTNANGNTIPSLDVTGRFSGTSTIPIAGSYDCSASIGFQGGSGLCTATGLISSGTFNLQGQGSTVFGSYSTTWTIPAFAFTAAGSATVTASSNR